MMAYVKAMGELDKIPQYNCSIYKGLTTVDHDMLSTSLLIIGVPTEILYFFCLIVMLQKKLRQTTCYKIMIYLGIIDMGAIAINCLETAILFKKGAQFCTYPDLIYVTGSIALSLWCSSCITCFVLVINRLYNLWHTSAATQVKTSDPPWRAIVCLILPTGYFFYFLLFTAPILFNSEKSAWFFVPFIPGMNDFRYDNYPHTVNNLLIVIITTASYVIFIVLLRAKYKKHDQKFSFKIVVQAVLMCFFNFIAAMVYVYMQYFPMWPPLIVIGHYCWVLGHACPPYLYFYLNSTIRRRLKKLLWCGKRAPRTILPAGGSLAFEMQRVQQVEELNLPHLMKYNRPLELEVSDTM